MNKVEIFYHRYSYLADYYADRIWNSNNIGMEKDDIKQELRIKLFLAIKTYAKKWGEYKKTGRLKPMPIEFYLKTVMLNQVRDFIKQINKVNFCPLEEASKMHVGQEVFEISKLDIKIGFQNMSDLFVDKNQKRVMKLFFLYKFEIKNVFQFGKGESKKEKEQNIKNLVDDGLLKMREYLEIKP